ncbi:ATP-binding cassette domain-containing protein [Methanocaldococcus fervens]|uniref:Daunorubicin resistance ABC transporter ATPase subunit n=1 Tax=Methanocaldococcus fervens (strain DSM 4213 / JCM 15782 / AG86) TaxID=573064 RepID=C7P8R3_METFA|nr:ATP-binding cassette domain-containing protein [Methanocaldococcus fervens]ACV24945.1 daunorubicin resistance ABC transporter ATPase subunit [Methanocaldococcus fervens AG86]
MEYVIEVENLTKKFNDFYAVKGISFKVKKGEIFAFLGPNGAGKSTTINMITTLLKPTSGTIKVAGYDVVKNPNEVRKRIGIVFQDTTLDRELTAYENLYIHGKIYGYRGEELKKRIEEMLEFVELKEHAHRIVKYFSGGMVRRLEIARALIHKPEILFLDEPTVGLDPQTRAHIWDYIKEMKEEYNMTIFLTTHYMEEAESLADRIAIIDNGKIIAMGTVDELKSIIGDDIIYLRFNNDNHEKIKNMLSQFGECKIIDGIFEIKVKNAPETIPKIFEIALKNNLEILEVDYRKPTLNDVFIYLTGRSIRDEGGKFDMRRFIMKRRGFA